MKLKFFKLRNKNYTIDSLDVKKESISIDDRKNVKIVFVDDEGYDIDTIKRLGFKDTDKMFAYNDLSDFEKYDVIFCDVNGVAPELDPIFQGAELARQIKKLYPSKFVIIYSSRNQGLNITKYKDEVDYMIEKNTKPAGIAEYIDEYIRICKDYKYRWEYLNKELKKYDLSESDLSLIEEIYVKSIQDNKNYTENLETLLKVDSINLADILSIVSSVISIWGVIH